MSRNNRDYISCRNPAATKQQPSSRRQVGTGWCEIWSTAKQKKITGRR